ncbi:Tetratricopeptide repeat (TPR)-like superfamily protein [Striga hermonthica]|uniref:Tetratricopeptide repeat (TPR)-like superfamily protein n=1 Tax=Striga hermonthica TaxID=68872 RepID=A0A9N7RG33_STRHE|nr:Tetratricopeptide repeat (TPR)-like superfamily protein [Striga hermonthica]
MFARSLRNSPSNLLFPLPIQTKHTFSYSRPASAAAARPESFISLCAQGRLKEAIAVHFPLIQSKPVLVSHLLKACIACSSLPKALQVHSVAIAAGWSDIKFVSNHLVNAYTKLGSLETALKVFDKMPHKNIMSYNIIISGHIQNGQLDLAMEVLEEMGPRNIATWNAVIAGMIRFEQNEEGLRLFHKMHENGISPDAYTLSSVQRGCAGLKDLAKGKQVHGYTVKSGLGFDLAVGSSTAHMYMRCGCLQEGELLIELMTSRNLIAFNTLIAGRVWNGFPSGALDAYLDMRTAGLRPDKITFASLITSCSDLSTLSQGQQIHSEVVKAGVTSVAAVNSSLISMYSHCGCLNEAVRVFEEKGSGERDHVLWSSMISAYGFHGKGKEAMEIFKEMEIDGIEANEVTFLSLLYACSHCGLKDEGFEFIDKMVNEYGLKPDAKHYTCLVDLLGRSGRLEEAEGLIRSMPVEVDAITWKTLLSACKIHKNADMAGRITEEIIKLDPHDSASYVLLSNTQASARRWQDVLEVRKKMNGIMVKKELGISWVELKNKFHIFSVGDKSHPMSEEIESCLNDLMVEIRARGYVPNLGASLHDMDLEENEYNLAHHSEKLALAFALMSIPL